MWRSLGPYAMGNECDEDCEHQVKPIHFLRFILPHTLQQGKLMIPRMFVKKYGESLPKTVFLKTPNGVEWKVNLVKHDGTIWFQKGWKEFEEYHSLAEGHILVFRYEGTSNFQVTSFLEVDNHFETGGGKRASNDQGNKLLMVEGLKDCRPSERIKNHSTLEFLQQFKKKSSRCVEVEVGSTSSLSKATLHHSSQTCEEEPKTKAKQITALDRANPCCLVVMHPSYLHSQAKLMMPGMFVEKYGEGLPKIVFLKPSNGVEWKVNLVKHDGGIWFQEGWKEFAEYHSLAEGYIVVFRYEKASNFQVLIFDLSALEIDYPFKRVESKRASSNDQGNKPTVAESSEAYKPSQKRKDNLSLEVPQQFKKSSRYVDVDSIRNLSKATLHHTSKQLKEGQHSTAKQITALDKARSFKPCNPSCVVFMRPSYINYKANLHLPTGFGRRYFDSAVKRGDTNLRLANGSVWTASYRIIETSLGTRFVLLRGGWNRFARDNNLKVGDACIFELVDRTKLTFQVYIFRETDKSNCSTSRKKPVTVADEQTTALDRARSFKPFNPSFLVVMHPSYINTHGLGLPAKFCKRHFDLDKKGGDINLQVSNDRVRVWQARYLKRAKRNMFLLSGGWKAFAKDNNLKVGDICIFELIEKITLTFHVHIFREIDNSICSTSQEPANGPPNI
ncbi:hypothetical protein RIF29_29653 [Crotalaria pallida]|uniref:Uncharacterized protein n=1 Tax=Crotalaria pallida TaxID=3830 RepID=A0AAN9EK48_CROPI